MTRTEILEQSVVYAELTVSSAARRQQLGSQMRAEHIAKHLVEASRVCPTGTYTQHARAGSCLKRMCSVFRQPGAIEHNPRIEHKDVSHVYSVSFWQRSAASCDSG